MLEKEEMGVVGHGPKVQKFSFVWFHKANDRDYAFAYLQTV